MGRGCLANGHLSRQRFARENQLGPGPIQARQQVDGVERVPTLVVVGSHRVRDAPVRSRPVRVVPERLLETGDGLLVVEPEGPDDPTVEPHCAVADVVRIGRL